MKIRILYSLLAGLLAAGCSPSFTVTRTREDLQRAVAKRFPISHEEYLVKVTLANPTVLLRGADRRVGIELDATVTPPIGGSLKGRVAALGEPWYDRNSKSFFLRNPVVERIDVPGFPMANNEKVRAALTSLTARALEGTPVYTLEGRNADEVKAQMWLKEVYVKDDRLHFVLAP